MNAVIRLATEQDAQAIGHVSAMSWRAAYAGLMPDSLLREIDEAKRADTWREHRTNPDLATFVAELLGEVVGFSMLKTSTDEDSLENTGNIPTLYLLPEYWGRGVGFGLWSAMQDAAVERGFRDVTVWVLEENLNGRSFYERQGMEVDGGTKVVTGFTGHEFHEVRYRCAVGTPTNTGK